MQRQHLRWHANSVWRHSAAASALAPRQQQQQPPRSASFLRAFASKSGGKDEEETKKQISKQQQARLQRERLNEARVRCLLSSLVCRASSCLAHTTSLSVSATPPPKNPHT